MCENTWLDGTVWMCSLMEKPCPYVKPIYTKECVEMKVKIKMRTWEKNELKK